MLKNICRVSIAALATIVLVLQLQVQAETPPKVEFNLSVSGNIAGIRGVFMSKGANGSGSVEALSGMELQANLPGLGSSKIAFSSLKRKDWVTQFTTDQGVVPDTHDVVLLKGEIESGGGKEIYPAAGAIYEEGTQPILHVFFKDPEELAGGNSYQLKLPLNNDGSVAPASVSAVPLAELQALGCGAASDNHTVASSSKIIAAEVVSDAPVSIQAIKTTELATDADFEWFQIYGSGSNAAIAALMNAINVIYERDVEVTFSLKFQNVWTTASDPYTLTASSSLLSEFASYTNTNQHLGSADLYHLFSGKDFDSTVVGIAYVGVVCAFPTYSYGATQRYSDTVDYIILAHELGHNFDASHDDATPNTIMNSAVSLGANSFSATSKGEISSWVNTNGSCLAVATSPTPTPTPTPTPSVAPTPTATPTPTPPGGGGGGGLDPSPDPSATPDPRAEPDATPSVSLTGSFNQRSGKLTLNVETDDADYSPCALRLLMSLSSSFSSSRSKVISSDLASGSYTVIANSLSKKVKLARGESSSIYLQARYYCSGTNFVASETLRLRMPSSNRSGYPARKTWLKSAVGRLTSN